MKALITLFTLATLAGCATMISQTPIPPCEAKSCFTEMKGSVDAGGGGRYGVAGITVVGKDGSQNFKPIVDGVHPDRIDTLLPSGISGYFQYRSADRTADAIENSSRRSGPSQVFLIEGGDAAALQNTEVGVGVTQQQLQKTLPTVEFGADH